jgi:hypothetical protein
VTIDLAPSAVPVDESHRTSASACEVYCEMIELGLSQGRNVMGSGKISSTLMGLRTATKA